MLRKVPAQTLKVVGLCNEKKIKENNDVLINFKILRKKIVGTCLQYFSAATPLVFYVQIRPKVIILLGSIFVVIPVTY